MYRGKHRSTLLTLFVLQNVVGPLVYDQASVALWGLPEDELVLPDGPHAPPLGADAAAAVDRDVGAHAGLEPDAAPGGGDRAVGGGGGAVVASPSAAGGGGLIAQAPVHDKSTELNVFRNQMCRLLSYIPAVLPRYPPEEKEKEQEEPTRRHRDSSQKNFAKEAFFSSLTSLPSVWDSSCKIKKGESGRG